MRKKTHIVLSTLLFFCLFSKIPLEAFCAPPVQISTPFSDVPQIGMDAASNTIAIWPEFSGGVGSVQSAIFPKGGNWSLPITVDSAAGHAFSNVQIAVNAAGNAVAIWEDFNGATSTVESAMLPFGGTWSTPTALSTPSTGGGTVQIAMNSSGYVVAVWNRFNGSIYVIESATLQFGGSWSAVSTVSAPAKDSNPPQVAIDSVGNAVAVWGNATDNTIQTSSLPFGGTWSSPFVLALSLTSFNVHVAMNPSGYAVATWENSLGVQAATLQFGGAWVPTSNLFSAGFVAQVAVDLAGNAIAITQEPGGILQTSSLPFGSSVWVGPLIVSPGSSAAARVIFDTSGNAYAVWDTFIGGGLAVVQAATLPFGGSSWSFLCNLSSLSGNSQFPQIAIDSTGYAVVDWLNNDLFIIQAAMIFPPPTVTNVNPNFGLVIGGNSVTITGTNFIDVTAVNFGLTSALSFMVTSPTTIIATAPPGAVGTVDVRVTTVAGTSPITVDDQYTYQNPLPPTVTNVNPNFGPTTGGNQVTINGTNFILVSGVAFGATNALNFTVISPTTIIATAPPGFPGTVDVRVTTISGTSPITVSDQYTYQNLTPSNFVGTIKKNKFLNKTECTLETSWNASVSPDVILYRIYQNGVVVATVLPTSGLVFKTCLQNCSANGFELAAVSSINLESGRVALRIVN